MATVYRSTDAGAPSYPASSTNGAAASAFMDILKACLVDGYGSKPAAGWSVDYEDTTVQKRRIGLSNGNGVFEVVTWASVSVGLFIWDSITTPGVGSIYDDSWPGVVSEGVNGWQHERIPAPGNSSDAVACLYVNTFQSSQASNIAWTVVADDKAFWFLSHYPEGHSSVDASDSLNNAKGSYYPQLFVGAVKSPDLLRDDPGNFFLGFGGGSVPTAVNATGGSQQSLSNFWGLRTPVGTLPSAANNSDFEPYGLDFDRYKRNPLSSVRALLPALCSYKGSDVPKPSSLSSLYADYHFCSLPGICQLGESGSQGYFWINYNEWRGASWSLEPATIGGYTWIPWSFSQNDLYECGVTDHPDWW